MQTRLSLALCTQSQRCAHNHKGGTKIELSCIIHIRVHTNKVTSEKLRRHNLIFIYEDRPVSREAQTDLDRCLVLRLSTGSCSN